MIENQNIHIVMINGSVRPGNHSFNALKISMRTLKKIKGVSVTFLDPSKLNLQLPGQAGESDAEEIQKTVRSADGIIISTPEYIGSYSSVIKLIIDNLGYPSALEGKPVGMIGVAAGVLGATKALEHLRSVLSHAGCLVLPKSVSIANSFHSFDKAGEIKNEEYKTRLQSLANTLVEFIRK